MCKFLFVAGLGPLRLSTSTKTFSSKSFVWSPPHCCSENFATCSGVRFQTQSIPMLCCPATRKKRPLGRLIVRVAGLGIEPKFSLSESDVLPLDDPAMYKTDKEQVNFHHRLPPTVALPKYPKNAFYSRTTHVRPSRPSSKTCSIKDMFPP